jgi:hypothetical protein
MASPLLFLHPELERRISVEAANVRGISVSRLASGVNTMLEKEDEEIEKRKRVRTLSTIKAKERICLSCVRTE